MSTKSDAPTFRADSKEQGGRSTSSVASESAPKSPVYELEAKIDKSKNTVLIWNLEEVLLIFGNSLTRRARKACSSKNKLKEEAISVSRRMEKFISELATSNFFFKQLSDFEPVTISSMLQFDDQKDLTDYDFRDDDLRSRNPTSQDRTRAAYRFRKIEEFYETKDISRRISADLYRDLTKTYEQIEKLSEGWINYARQAIKAALERSNVTNIFITSGNLVSSIAKLVAFRFQDIVRINDLYSYSATGKKVVMDEIKDTYPHSEIVLLGDVEDEALCRQKGIPFRRISGLDELKQLHTWIIGDLVVASSTQSSLKSEKQSMKSIPESPKPAQLRTPRDKTPADNGDFDFLELDSKPNSAHSTGKPLGYEPYTPLTTDLQNIYPKYGDFPESDDSSVNLNTEAPMEEWSEELFQ